MMKWEVYVMYRVFVLILVLVTVGAASAAVVTLPNTTQTTTFTATVSEQANVSVPAGVAFAVTNVSASTASSAQSVSATVIVLADGKGLRIEIAPNAAAFTKPAGTVTWAASDISWNAATWTNGTGDAGTLSSAAWTRLVQTTQNSASTTTTNLVFTLGDKATVDRAGNHTLVCTWQIFVTN